MHIFRFHLLRQSVARIFFGKCAHNLKGPGKLILCSLLRLVLVIRCGYQGHMHINVSHKKNTNIVIGLDLVVFFSPSGVCVRSTENTLSRKK